MARKANARPVGVSYVFIPKSFENHKDPNPIRIHITAISERQKRQMVETRDPRTPLMSMQSTIKEVVTKVENYTDSNGRPISNGEDLFEHGEHEIVDETVAEILNSNIAVPEKQEKKSES